VADKLRLHLKDDIIKIARGFKVTAKNVIKEKRGYGAHPG
jgi:hypothetical protein